MNRRDFLATGLTALASPIGVSSARAQTASSVFPTAGADGWSPLFNGKNLDGWYTFLVRSGKNNDPTGYVRIEDGMLHCLGNAPQGYVEGGYLATNQEYSNYHFRVEYKWGSARYAPRLMYKRDSGIYFHMTGPDRVWPTGMHFQIQESDTGDVLAVNGTRFVTAAPVPNAAGGNPTWPNPPNPNNPNIVTVGSQGQPRGWRKNADFEKLEDWNQLEIIARDDRAAYLVNGRLVNTLFNMQAPDPPAPANLGPTANAAQQVPTGDTFKRLDRGKIAIEIEFAEIWFRNIEIRPLNPGEHEMKTK